METTSRLTNQPFLILYPVIFQKEKEKKLKSNHIPVDHICSGYPICGVESNHQSQNPGLLFLETKVILWLSEEFH